MPQIPIKAIYSISELKDIFNYKSSASARSMLKKLSIPMNLVGGKYIVYLSDIQIKAPSLYSSMLECNNVETLKIEQESEEYQLLKAQFKDFK